MDSLFDSQDLIDEKLDPLFFCTSIYTQQIDLRSLAKEGCLSRGHNRFVSWRIFLNILPQNDPAAWPEVLQKYRSAYFKLKNEMDSVKVSNLDPSISNPLSQASENPWNSFYQDNELKQTIRKDIDRTLQERSLFQEEATKQMMLKVLFIWAKQNPSISYRQGMNELLAIILLVAYMEKSDPEMSLEDKQAERILKELNDPDFMEADIFELFSKLMDLGVKEMFLPVITKKPKLVNNSLSFDKNIIENDLINQDKFNDSSSSSILKKCHRVHHRLLKAIDKPLYNFLESQKIEPQIYLQRWIRCVFTREFNLSNTLILWDCIFANVHSQLENRLESYTGKLDPEKEVIMIEFICVAMIIFVKSFLLQSDSIGIMRRLLKFPPVEDVKIIIDLAQSYQERVFLGKGVTVPNLHLEEAKNEGPKTQTVLMVSPKNRPKIKGKIESVVSLLQNQAEWYCLNSALVDVRRMNEALEILNEMKLEIEKLRVKS